MAIFLTQSVTAVGIYAKASFLAAGGTAPYTYSVVAGGAGGTINSSTGMYTAPAAFNSDPLKAYDTIRVVDAAAAATTARILVGSPLLLLCDIIQNQLGLSTGRVYLWDQKIMQPNDSGLYVAISVPHCKPFANVNRQVSGGAGVLNSAQFVSMVALVDIDIISKGPTARDRKEEVLLALASNYAQQQQNANSFFIGTLPAHGAFINLSDIDGAAIPYRYKISINMQYAYEKTTAVQFFDEFELEETIDQ